MKIDLLLLPIKTGELSYAVGDKGLLGIYEWTLTSRRAMGIGIGVILLVGLTPLSISLLRDFLYSSRFMFDTVFYLLLGSWGFLGWGVLKLRSGTKHKSLGKLLLQAQKYNKVISGIHVLDQSRMAGDSVSLRDRKLVIEVVEAVRRVLIRALENERLLRKNPDSRYSDWFFVDLSLYAMAEMAVQSDEYGALLRTLLDVGIESQLEMRRIHRQHMIHRQYMQR